MAFIYGAAYYEYAFPNSWVPIHVSYMPYMKNNYPIIGDYRYYPITFFVYNRLTFDEETTMFNELISDAYNVWWKELPDINKTEVRAKIGPIILVDTFHAYANSIWETPINKKNPAKRYDTKFNYYRKFYMPYASSIYCYYHRKYYDKDPIAALTNISSIVVIYVPTSPALVRIVGYDPKSKSPIVSSALVLSILNNNGKLAQIVLLNPFKFANMYDKYRGKMPDILVLLSPGAGLTDGDYSVLKSLGYKWPGKWVSLAELFHRMGAKVVVATKLLPDTYKYFKVKTGNNKYMYFDTSSSFPYVARPWLRGFLYYLGRGYTVEKAALQALNDLGDKTQLWYYYIKSLITSSNITDAITEMISELYKLVNKAQVISDTIDALIDVMMILTLRASLLHPDSVKEIIEDYYKEIILDTWKNFLVKYYNQKVSNLNQITKELINILEGILVSFQFDDPDTAKKILDQLTSSQQPLEITIVGMKDYKLITDGAQDPPSDGNHYFI